MACRCGAECRDVEVEEWIVDCALLRLIVKREGGFISRLQKSMCGS
jgi:hypothetical protein